MCERTRQRNTNQQHATQTHERRDTVAAGRELPMVRRGKHGMWGPQWQAALSSICDAAAVVCSCDAVVVSPEPTGERDEPMDVSHQWPISSWGSIPLWVTAVAGEGPPSAQADERQDTTATAHVSHEGTGRGALKAIYSRDGSGIPAGACVIQAKWDTAAVES